jgi:ABC-2 type transport system permease protein
MTMAPGAAGGPPTRLRPAVGRPAEGAARPPRPPSARSLGWRRAGFELREFSRDKEAVFFTALFPLMILLLFGSIFGTGEVEDTGVTFPQVLAAGIIGSGILSVSFVNLSMGIAYEREQGVLKRLRATPMPPAAYFVGKTLFVFVVGVVETVLLLAVAVALFGLELPSTPERWFTFAWVFVLGISSGTALGIAYSSLARNAKTAAAVVQPPFIFLQFVSGVYLLYNQLPPVLQQVGALFPLKWMTQGLRSVFLPDSFQVVEPAGSWERPKVFLVLLAWTVAGFVLCRLTFRWKSSREG